MGFRLTPRSMTLDDLELLSGRILSEFRVISRVWEDTTAKRMQIDPYCQRKCSPVNVVSSNIRVMQIFAGVREIWGVKQESGRLRCRFSYHLLAIFSESSSSRLKSATHSICVKLLHKHDKLTQCCRAFTLALARLSCQVRGSLGKL